MRERSLVPWNTWLRIVGLTAGWLTGKGAIMDIIIGLVGALDETDPISSHFLQRRRA